MMNATNSTHVIGGRSAIEGMQTDGLVPADKRAILQRPTQSAANKYRHMIQGGGAIAEEIDYEGH